MSNQKLRVLLTNDDGPPGHDSPYIFGLYRHLTKDLGWDVKVVIPSSQKSWIGKAYQITETIHGRYYYPREDGLGETSETTRPLKEGEVGEWVLLDGTPATCANIGLHNLFPEQIDLLISGPNLGRNSSSAFALSSGTIGAALSSSLSQVRSIALSYGTVMHPTPTNLFEPAHLLSSKVVRHLWDNWGTDEGGLRNGEVDLYNVNIPMVHELLSDEGLKIYWTNIWRNSYGRLFKVHVASNPAMSPAGPDSLDSQPPDGKSPAVEGSSNLTFKFSPDMKNLLDPNSSPTGTDGWAISKGHVSVTALRASFAEPGVKGVSERAGDDVETGLWKQKL
ncbi:hypothetical protein QCA50_001815 [Cerrena zonata]|uniref:Survival protein SurE-like phosphatase/nucleotidase domain-containing protein n=1 Tax=Cerrena zonata TaxID=2478898 RepID=A0AAW0GMR1_9APHY